MACFPLQIGKSSNTPSIKTPQLPFFVRSCSHKSGTVEHSPLHSAGRIFFALFISSTGLRCSFLEWEGGAVRQSSLHSPMPGLLHVGCLFSQEDDACTVVVDGATEIFPKIAGNLRGAGQGMEWGLGHAGDSLKVGRVAVKHWDPISSFPT